MAANLTQGTSLEQLVDSIAMASTTEEGLTKLSSAPVDPDHPIAVGNNDARLNDVTTSTHGLMLAADKVKLNSLQGGVATLVAGSATVATATITANSRIVACRKTAGGTVGAALQIPAADRSVGAPGSFKIYSVDETGSAAGSDTSTVDWIVLG